MANNTLLASDTFVSGSLSPTNWTAISTQAKSQITGTPFVAEAPSVGTAGRQYWSGLIWPADQASELTIANLSDTASSVDLWVRVQAGAYSGYALSVNGSGGGTLFKCVAGVFTSLGGVGGFSITANSIVTLQVAGAVLTVSSNNKPLLRVVDTTYAAGSPGFSQGAATSVTTSKIGAWRGYSTAQQDGIWNKQGVLAGLVPTAADGTSGVANATMLYEGNAQLLSGTVYKMWFSNGNGSNVYYAESTDGINWTRKSGNVIAGTGFPFIIKNGATYHIYTQTTGGSGNFSHYTSSDGVNWVLQSSNVFGLGAIGQWDHSEMWYFQPIAILAGTWYAVYCAGNDGTTQLLKLGLATSSDGITWTRSPSNPVLTGANGGSVVNSSALALVGSTYYMWMYGSQPGVSSVAAGLDPGEGVRYKTKDFITWTLDAHSVHRSEMYEGVNFQTGQTYPNSIFTVGGKTYLYMQTTPSDNTPSLGYQLALAIAPASIASIVAQNEDGMPQIATDPFTSGIGDLSANWTTPSGLTKLQIVGGNLVEATATGVYCGMRYTGASFTDNQFSEITVHTNASSSQVSDPAVRMQSSNTCYFASCTGALGSATTCSIWKMVSGALTQIGPSITITPQVGDTLRLSVVNVNSVPTLTFYQNQFSLLQVEDTSNAIPSGGNPGFLINAVTLVQVQVSNWSGGNANVVPTYGTLTVNGRVLGVANFKAGTPVTAPVSFGNVVNWAITPSHFGDLSQGQQTQVQWTPTPTHFGTKQPGNGAVTLTGSDGQTATTDALGNFTLNNVSTGAYTITPSLAGYVFEPASLTINITDSVNGIDFSGVQA